MKVDLVKTIENSIIILTLLDVYFQKAWYNQVNQTHLFMCQLNKVHMRDTEKKTTNINNV